MKLFVKLISRIVVLHDVFKNIAEALPCNSLDIRYKCLELTVYVNLFRQFCKYCGNTRQTSNMLLILYKVGYCQKRIGNTNSTCFRILNDKGILW